jgi:hypothetical protein
MTWVWTSRLPSNMAPTLLQSNTEKDENIKPQMEQVESLSVDEGFTKSNSEKVDRFGAHEKTNPKEIALVKKLDVYILVG